MNIENQKLIIEALKKSSEPMGVNELSKCVGIPAPEILKIVNRTDEDTIGRVIVEEEFATLKYIIGRKASK